MSNLIKNGETSRNNLTKAYQAQAESLALTADLLETQKKNFPRVCLEILIYLLTIYALLAAKSKCLVVIMCYPLFKLGTFLAVLHLDLSAEFGIDIPKPRPELIFDYLTMFMGREHHILYFSTNEYLELQQTGYFDCGFNVIFSLYYIGLYHCRQEMLLAEKENDSPQKEQVSNKRQRRKTKRQKINPRFDSTQSDSLLDHLSKITEPIDTRFASNVKLRNVNPKMDRSEESKEEKETLQSTVETKNNKMKENKLVNYINIINQNFVPYPAHFFQACLYGHKEIVRQLLASNGHELDIQLVEPATGYTAFHLACDRGHLSVVHQLMTFFGNESCRQLITSEGKSGLILGAELGRIEIIKALLDTYKKKELRYISFNKKTQNLHN